MILHIFERERKVLRVLCFLSYDKDLIFKMLRCRIAYREESEIDGSIFQTDCWLVPSHPDNNTNNTEATTESNYRTDILKILFYYY